MRSQDCEGPGSGPHVRGRRYWARRIALLVVSGVVLLALRAALIPTGAPTLQAKILDSRLRVFSVEVVEGTRTLYFGNQWEGRIRDRLKRWGLPIEPLSRGVYGQPAGTRTFLVWYDYPLPDVPTAHLEAELADAQGTVFPLHCGAGGRHESPRKYWNLWTLDALPSHRDNCVLRLRLQTSETPVAEITIDKL